MRSVPAMLIGSAALLLTGCQYDITVRFINDSPLPTDFRIDEPGVDLDTFVQDVAAGGGAVTVPHKGVGGFVTIGSGVVIGQQLTVQDAACTVRITDGDTLDVVKMPSGELECRVTPGANSTAFSRSAKKLADIVTGRR